MVDAAARQLLGEGFVPNRARMIAASFLTKHLLIDWRWGEAWFARWLMDFELSSNNGNWQWAAGSGCDAAPYFRVFNPQTQLERFDPRMEYVLRWAPECFGEPGDLKLAAAGYNAGEGAVDKYKGVPPYAETQRYVQRVAVLAERYRNAASGTSVANAAGSGAGSR